MGITTGLRVRALLFNIALNEVCFSEQISLATLQGPGRGQ
jgi:hypothetical protein